MSHHKKAMQLVFALLLALTLANPLQAFASDAGVGTAEAVPEVTDGEDANSDAPNGEGTEGESSEEEGSESRLTGDPIVTSFGSQDEDPDFYCNYANKTGAGDVYAWLTEGEAAGANVDCIDVLEPDVEGCSLDIPFESRVTGFPSSYYLLWAEGDTIPADSGTWHSSWPISFSEDYNGGSVTVIVFIGGPEDDYYHFANEDPYPYPYPNIDRGEIKARSLGGGVEYTVNTNCLPDPTPEEYYCDFRNQPSQGSVADWWKNAGVAPKCIELEIINSPASCSLTANFSSYVVASVSDKPYAHVDALTYYETDENGKVLREGGLPYPSPVLNMGTTGPVGPEGGSFTITFPEDYNGGTAYVLINFNSPEKDIQVGLTPWELNHWRTTSPTNGVVYAINTDCITPVAPELPTITLATCDSANQPVAPSVVAPPDRDGVTYSPVTATPVEGGITFTLTATADPGFTFKGATLPDGYALVTETEVAFTVTLTTAECPLPTIVPTEEPTLAPTEVVPTEEPTKAPEVKELPKTGAGSASFSTIALAVSAAMALAGVGIFATNRKR